MSLSNKNSKTYSRNKFYYLMVGWLVGWLVGIDLD
jgi:hypothetical protein